MTAMLSDSLLMPKAPGSSNDAAEVGGPWFIPAMLAVISAPALLIWGFPSLVARLLSGAALPIHAVFETLYVAGAAAIFSVVWHSPRDAYRFRPTLVACMCVPIIAFDLLHSVLYIGMPDFFGINSDRSSWGFGLLARMALPFVLGTMAVVPHSVHLTNRQRWKMLVVTIACVVTIASMALVFREIAFSEKLDLEWALPVHSTLAVLLLLTACAAARASNRVPVGTRYLVLSALLAALAEACFMLGSGSEKTLDLLGHVYGLLGLGCTCIAAYGEAVAFPYQEIKQSRATALLERDRVETVLQSIADGVVVVDRRLMVVSMNQVARRLIGVPGKEIPGDDLRALLAPTGASSIVRELETCLRKGGTYKASESYTMFSRTGSCSVVEHVISPICGEHGGVQGAVLVLRDVTDMQQVHIQLQFQANFDALTALPNRRLFRDRIQAAMDRAWRRDCLLAVMFIDIDDFKDINESLGHSVGDELIKRIAVRLVETLREADTVARIGGDEFGILIEDLTQAEEVQPLAEKLLNAVATPISLDDNEVTVSCSIGVSIFPIDPGDADTLLRNADAAVYGAKESGKNNCRFYTESMNAEIQRRVLIANRMRQALRQSEFVLHYQPQIDIGDGSVVGVEALIRWHPEGGGPVSPAEFIPIAEATGMILPIGEWVLREACRQTAQWLQETGLEFSVAVNISARQFRDSDLAGTVLRILGETGLPAHLLELELTESMLMKDATLAAETLKRLKAIGLRLAIDDFGTGYSSLSYLKRFPLDRLKVDRSFVVDLPTERKDKAIVRSIIMLGHNLGLKVIAEGVETAEQLALLRKLGCDEVQGYFFSRPHPPGEMLDFLHNYCGPAPLVVIAAPSQGSSM